MSSSSYKATGHLKPREAIPEAQEMAVAALARDGYGYRQIVALLRGMTPSSVTEQEIRRFGEIARERGCGVNNYRLLLTKEALDVAVAKVGKMNSDAVPKQPNKTVLAAFISQAERQAEQRKKNRRGGKRAAK